MFFEPEKRPSTYQHFTSNPPQIHQRKTTFCTPFLPKPPAKTGKPAQKKLLQKRSLFGLGLGFFGGDDDGGGYLVVAVEVEEFDAAGGAAGGADALGVDADDLAELADQHQLAGLVYKIDSSDFTDLRRRLHVDDALAAA